MVLTASPVKEYDKRIELLTKEYGRISAFVTGARKVNSILSACAIPFTFGTYQLYQGRSSYNVHSAQIKTYFSTIADDFDRLCYASYFAEMAQYFTRENVEAHGELLLLYVTCSALTKGKVSMPLIRTIYEMRMMQIQGEALEVFQCLKCGKKESGFPVYISKGGCLCPECVDHYFHADQSHMTLKEKGFRLSGDALYALQYVLTAPLEKLYTFRVSREVEQELASFMKEYLNRYLHHSFRSLEFL
jgi:DNA repair protein RecO (recombination protein O)